MASPITLYTVRDCGLQIKILKADLTDWRHRFDQNFRSSSVEYLIKNNNELRPSLVNKSNDLLPDESLFTGRMSPTSPVTLSNQMKISAGIPANATRFAFIHPPIGLANNIKKGNEFETSQMTNNKKSSRLTLEVITSFSLLGAFIYLDEQYRVLSVNALSNIETENKIYFSGPFEVTQEACIEIQELNRTDFVQLEMLHEAGFEMYGWVNPNEFKSTPLSLQYSNDNGAMIFFRDNGTAVTYMLDHIPYIDPSGGIETITEAYKVTLDNPATMESFVRKSMPYNRIMKWREIVNNMTHNGVDAALAIGYGGKTLLHKACHAGFSSDFIFTLLKFESQKENVSHKDQLLWTPLHYACRFIPHEVELIKALIDLYPPSVSEPDYLGRYPLHLACDSNAPKEVISLLLNADKSGQVILKKTKNLGRLPIHIACNQETSSEIIQLLLEGDISGKTIRETTLAGHLPIHLAILNKLHADVIKSLLNADLKLGKLNTHRSDIYQISNGMLPLHIACWNRSSVEIVSLLLEKDHRSVTIDEKISKCNDAFNKVMGGMIPLHIAAKYGTSNVVRLLLQKEIQKERFSEERSSIESLDAQRRCPLHVACENNSCLRTIQLLLGCDPIKQTLFFEDAQGFKPIHHLCSHSNADAKTIQLLLETEKEYSDKFSKSCDKQIKTPLSFAVEAAASDDCIKLLLHKDCFTLKGFTPSGNWALADRIATSSILQNEILETLTKRSYISVLFLQFYVNICAIATFIDASESFLTGKEVGIQQGILWAVVVFYLLRETIQIVSQGVLRYLSDIWSWVELIICILLIKCLLTMDRNLDLVNPQLFVATAGLLMVEFITLLRATLYPIARFLLGVFKIFRALIPFFVVTGTALLAFAYTLRLQTSNYTMGEDGDMDDLRCLTMKDCLLSTLGMFFNGQERMRNVFDITFAILAGTIMLNLVIAIVCEAWQSADMDASRIFWYFRLVFVTETSSYDFLVKIVPRYFSESIEAHVDNAYVYGFWDNIPWLQLPYKEIETREQYINPYKYFNPTFAEKVKNARSLQGDLRWLEKDWIRHKSGSYYHLEFFRCIMQYFTLVICHALFFILGFLTFGLLMPKSFRRRILTLWVPDPDDKTRDYEALYDKLEKVMSRKKLHGGTSVKSLALEELEKHVSLSRKESKEASGQTSGQVRRNLTKQKSTRFSEEASLGTLISI